MTTNPAEPRPEPGEPFRDPYTEDVRSHRPASPPEPAPEPWKPTSPRQKAYAAARRAREVEWAAYRPHILSDPKLLRSFLDRAIQAGQKQRGRRAIEEEFDFYFATREAEPTFSVEALRGALEMVDSAMPGVDGPRKILAAWTLAEDHASELDRAAAVVFDRPKLKWTLFRRIAPEHAWLPRVTDLRFYAEQYERLRAGLEQAAMAHLDIRNHGSVHEEITFPAPELHAKIGAFLDDVAAPLYRVCRELTEETARIDASTPRERRGAMDGDAAEAAKKLAFIGTLCVEVATAINTAYPPPPRTRQYERGGPRKTPGLYREPEVLHPTAEFVSALTGVELTAADVRTRLQNRPKNQP